MKDEQNQRFTSFDLITMAVSFAVIVAVSMPIIQKNFQLNPDGGSNQALEAAKRDLQVISQAVVSPQTLNTLAMNALGGADRAIASVDKNAAAESGKLPMPALDLAAVQEHLKKGEWEGEIGKDPWGSAYHFAFLRNKDGMPTHVAVWSDGPNKAADSSIHGQAAGGDDPGSVNFKGDDVGAVIPLR